MDRAVHIDFINFQLHDKIYLLRGWEVLLGHTITLFQTEK